MGYDFITNATFVIHKGRLYGFYHDLHSRAITVQINISDRGESMYHTH